MLILPFPRFTGIGGKDQIVNHFGNQGPRPDNHDARRMMAACQVVDQVHWHSLCVPRDDNPSVTLGPQQYGPIIRSQRQVRWIAHTDGVDRKRAHRVVPLQGPMRRKRR